MKVRFKKLSPNAVIPTKKHPTDAGYDLTATSLRFDEDGNAVYGTGIALEIPKGFVGLVFPRSSNAKKPLLLSNSVAVIDSGYRGELLLKFKPSMAMFSNDGELEGSSNTDRIYKVGERIAQIVIMPYPEIDFEESDELSEADRGERGFGSTGK